MAFLAYLVSLSCWFPRPAHAIEITDFVATNVLPDGELETRIHHRGVTAKETAVLKGYRKGLKYRELTDGKHFIQLIYDDDEVLRDCEYLHDHHEVTKFLKQFRAELRELIATSNVTITSLEDDAHGLNAQEHGWFHYENLRDQCRRRHRELKLMLRMDQKHNTSMIENESSKSRSKRAFLIMPGTYWCGLSDASSLYTDLGGMEATDKCCRIHDHCKNNILPFQKKFNYHNTGPFTISHCFCDASFRACLKMVRTSDANVVGKIFFNIVQTKCFVIKKKPVCRERTWRGKCIKKKSIKQAVLRANPRYK